MWRCWNRQYTINLGYKTAPNLFDGPLYKHKNQTPNITSPSTEIENLDALNTMRINSRLCTPFSDDAHDDIRLISILVAFNISCWLIITAISRFRDSVSFYTVWEQLCYTQFVWVNCLSFSAKYWIKFTYSLLWWRSYLCALISFYLLRSYIVIYSNVSFPIWYAFYWCVSASLLRSESYMFRSFLHWMSRQLIIQSRLSRRGYHLWLSFCF